MQIPGANPKKESGKAYWIPRPENAGSPAQPVDPQGKTQRALQRSGKSRGKHLDAQQAREIGELFRSVGQWGGW